MAGDFSQGRGDSEGEEQYASSAVQGVCSFPMAQGILTAEPRAPASSAKAGGCVQPFPRWVVGDEWSHVV